MAGTTDTLRSSASVSDSRKKRAVLNKKARAHRSTKEKIESCVRQLKAKGRSKSSAFAICTESARGK